jgi:hypothetical protein
MYFDISVKTSRSVCQSGFLGNSVLGSALLLWSSKELLDTDFDEGFPIIRGKKLIQPFQQHTHCRTPPDYYEYLST